MTGISLDYLFLIIVFDDLFIYTKLKKKHFIIIIVILFHLKAYNQIKPHIQL